MEARLAKSWMLFSRSGVRGTVHLVLQLRSRNVEDLQQVNHDLDEQDFLENDHLAHQQHDDEVLLHAPLRVPKADFERRKAHHEAQAHNEEAVQVLEGSLQPVEREVEGHVERGHQAEVLRLVVGALEEEDFRVENEKGVEAEEQDQDDRREVLPEERLQADVDLDEVGLLRVEVADGGRHVPASHLERRGTCWRRRSFRAGSRRR